MKQEQNSEAAETAQTTTATAVDMPRLDRHFIADEAPLGTIIQIGCDTPEQRIARSEFNSYLFQYFEQLASGQTGWGVDFHGWLEMARGWKHHGRKKYERIMSIGDMIDSEPNDPAQAPLTQTTTSAQGRLPDVAGSVLDKLQKYRTHPDSFDCVALADAKEAAMPLESLLLSVRTAAPILRHFENVFASSLSCDSRSHDDDREPRRMLNAILLALQEIDQPNVRPLATPPLTPKNDVQR